MDANGIKRRKIDFYIKGLSMDVRQNVFKKMDAINPISVEHLLEKPEGYPYFKSIHYTQSDIDQYLQRMKKLFDDANNYMIENQRYPIFLNTNDSYKCAQEYIDVLTLRPLTELEKEFGCSFQDYVPRVYRCNELSEL